MLFRSGQADFADHFFVCDFKSFAQDHRFGYADAEAFQVLVAGEFIESHGRYQYVAAGVGDAQQVEVTLQDTVFPRSAVDGDVGEVELSLFAVLHEAEVVTVYRCFGAVRKDPAISLELV